MSALRSRRVQVAGLLMLSSGMPLGFVLNTLQVFLRGAGVSLKTIGYAQVVSIPWSSAQDLASLSLIFLHR